MLLQNMLINIKSNLLSHKSHQARLIETTEHIHRCIARTFQVYAQVFIYLFHSFNGFPGYRMA